jgi:16S rRNA (uracil1498-N3)-methyltransferase
MKPSQRLFVTTSLNPEALIGLDGPQAHYLGNVLRLALGEDVLVFNGKDGEWRAKLTAVSKKGGELICVEQARLQKNEPDLWLAYAPIKGDRGDYIIEKACELGVKGIIPIITERTIVRKVNLDRLRARAVEAAEQCGRMSVPDIHDVTPLSAFYETPLDDGVLLFADETGGQSIGDALVSAPTRVSLLTGPEGGFTPSERAKLRACAHVRAIGLGPRILRAETATFAGLALIQAHWGDWY